MKRIIFCLACSIVVAVFAAGGENGVDVDATPPVPLPEPGEWLEYVVAYPLDPLEDSLRKATESKQHQEESDRTDASASPGNADGNAVFASPHFDPKITWRTLRLRLEIRERVPDGLRALLTVPGSTREVVIPLGARRRTTDNAAAALTLPTEEIFRGLEATDVSDKEYGSAIHQVGSATLDVAVQTLRDKDQGFVRLTHEDLPFALARFATADIDLVLVDRGRGQPPPFPVDHARIDPPPGKLYIP